jgi:nucleoside-diphosphate-sugar epimerase
MRVLIVGAGLVGTELARELTAAGHTVVGTTTTPAKVDALREVCAEVHVLRGSDTELVAQAAAGVDAVVVAAGPNAQQAMSVEERASSYHDVLVATAESVVGANPPYVIALSSLSVYGDAADHLDEVTEDSPVTTSSDPSPTKFLEMERTYLDGLPEQVCVFRCADIYGAGDPPIEVKVKMAHEYLKGSVPFDGDALFYRVNVADVVGAIEHALDTRITGVFNLTHDGVPATNGERFDAISAALGFPPFTYRGELKSPAKPISVASLAATGFSTQHTKVEVVA